MLCDCELGVIQQYNIYSKTATFFEKSGGNTYLGLAVALATWYNRKEIRKTFSNDPERGRGSYF